MSSGVKKGAFFLVYSLILFVFMAETVLAAVPPEYAVSPSKSPLVYLIQDAHDSLDAQESNRKILKSLIEKERVTHIFFEGGSLPLNRKFYSVAGREETDKKIWDALLREGKLSGLERAALEAPRRICFEGIEDEAVYFEHVKAIREVFSSDQKAEVLIYEEDERMEKEAARVLGPKNQKLLRLIHNFEAGCLVADRYIRELARMDRKIVSTGLMGADSPAEFLEKFTQVEADLFKHFSARPGEAEFLVRQRQWNLAKKMLRLRLSREERSRFTSLRNGLRPVRQSRGIFQTVQKYYEIAAQRDGILSQNLLARLRKDMPARAAVVVGGFHTEAVLNALEKTGINAIVVQPEINDASRKLDYRTRFATLPPPVEGALSVFLSHPEESPYHSRAASTGKSLGLEALEFWRQKMAFDRLVGADRARIDQQVSEAHGSWRGWIGKGVVVRGDIEIPAAFKLSVPVGNFPDSGISILVQSAIDSSFPFLIPALSTNEPFDRGSRKFYALERFLVRHKEEKGPASTVTAVPEAGSLGVEGDRMELIQALEEVYAKYQSLEEKLEEIITSRREHDAKIRVQYSAIQKISTARTPDFAEDFYAALPDADEFLYLMESAVFSVNAVLGHLKGGTRRQKDILWGLLYDLKEKIAAAKKIILRLRSEYPMPTEGKAMERDLPASLKEDSEDGFFLGESPAIDPIVPTEPRWMAGYISWRPNAPAWVPPSHAGSLEGFADESERAQRAYFYFLNLIPSESEVCISFVAPRNFFKSVWCLFPEKHPFMGTVVVDESRQKNGYIGFPAFPSLGSEREEHIYWVEFDAITLETIAWLEIEPRGRDIFGNVSPPRWKITVSGPRLTRKSPEINAKDTVEVKLELPHFVDAAEKEFTWDHLFSDYRVEDGAPFGLVGQWVLALQFSKETLYFDQDLNPLSAPGTNASSLGDGAALPDRVDYFNSRMEHSLEDDTKFERVMRWPKRSPAASSLVLKSAPRFYGPKVNMDAWLFKLIPPGSRFTSRTSAPIIESLEAARASRRQLLGMA
ncbi:MAG: hypothetical protein HY586_00650 [Candidatus Omnitrophica bacterium]|nr:hypothetical protein [Candidatus Omnitrophota bacterium]